jgi:hypothetical protein
VAVEFPAHWRGEYNPSIRPTLGRAIRDRCGTKLGITDPPRSTALESAEQLTIDDLATPPARHLWDEHTLSKPSHRMSEAMTKDETISASHG